MTLEFLPIKSDKVDWDLTKDNVIVTSEKSHFYCEGHKKWTEYSLETEPVYFGTKIYCKDCHLNMDQCPICHQAHPEVADWDITKPWQDEPETTGEMCRDCKENIFDGDDF